MLISFSNRSEDSVYRGFNEDSSRILKSERELFPPPSAWWSVPVHSVSHCWVILLWHTGGFCVFDLMTRQVVRWSGGENVPVVTSLYSPAVGLLPLQLQHLSRLKIAAESIQGLMTWTAAEAAETVILCNYFLGINCSQGKSLYYSFVVNIFSRTIRLKSTQS